MDQYQSELMEQFYKVLQLMHRHQAYAFRAYGPGGNPHRGQGRVLTLLGMQPEISQKELGYLLDMRNQSLGELLSKLEKSGYITRTPSEEDRRTMNITLTEAGKAAAAQQGRAGEDAGKVFEILTDEEQVILSGYMERIAAKLEESLAGIEENPERGAGGCGFAHRFGGMRGHGDPRMGMGRGHPGPHGFGPDDEGPFGPDERHRGHHGRRGGYEDDCPRRREHHERGDQET